MCELRVCELRVCELRVCESASCESASCESASCESAICEFTVGIYCLENAHLSIIVCAFDELILYFIFDRAFHSKECSRFTFSNFSNFGGKMTSSF